MLQLRTVFLDARAFAVPEFVILSEHIPCIFNFSLRFSVSKGGKRHELHGKGQALSVRTLGIGLKAKYRPASGRRDREGAALSE